MPADERGAAEGGPTRRVVLAGTSGLAAAAAGAAEAQTAGQDGRGRLGATINVRDFGAVGDGVADDTAAIQGCMNQAGRGRVTAGYNVAEVVFPPGVYRLSDEILLPFGSGVQSGVRPVRIAGHGAVLRGSGSGDDDHDCFVSARWSGTGEANQSTIRMRGQESVTFGVILEGFTISKFRRALYLKNWNQGCAVRDIFCLGVQQALNVQNCFYCQFINIKSRGTPDADTKPNFEIQSFANIAPMFGLHSSRHATGYRISGTHGLALYDCSFESADVGMLVTGDIPQLTVVNGYFEGCKRAGIKIAGVVRSLNLVGCFVNQEAARFIEGADNDRQFAYINFIGNRLHSGDLTLAGNIYGTFTGIGGSSPESDMPFKGGHKVVNLSPRFSVDQSRDGWNGPVRFIDASQAGGRPNPGLYRGGFGDQVAPNNRTPWQTIWATGDGPDTVWTVDTDIDFAENLFGSWLLEFDAGGRRRRFHFLLMGSHNGAAAEVRLYDGSPLTANTAWFSASDNAGKLRLTSVRLDRPTLVKSVIRIF